MTNSRCLVFFPAVLLLIALPYAAVSGGMQAEISDTPLEVGKL